MNREAICLLRRIFVCSALASLLLSPIAAIARSAEARAKPVFGGKIVASLNFDPAVDGFGFKNYGVPEYDSSHDMGAADMVRMFGAKAVCKNGKTAGCILKAAAQKWMAENLDAMGGGHCEGMAVSCLRFNWEIPFKGRSTPADYQKGIEDPFDLKLDKALANNIAYYWTTQSLDEVSDLEEASRNVSPVKQVQTLIEAFSSGSETYTIGICQRKGNECEKGHAITPFAVEELDTQYKIHVYDNNGPGETRFLTVQKAGKQTWNYVTSTNPKYANENYTGNMTTRSLTIVATSQREGECFAAPFDETSEISAGCSTEIFQTAPAPAASKPATPKKPASVPQRNASLPGARAHYADFFLTGDGDMMILDGKDRRLGYDPEAGDSFEEIPGGKVASLVGGLGRDMPHYKIPYSQNGDPYIVVFSGADLENENTMDFVFTGPDFSVGFANIRLDPDEFMVAGISADGERVTMEMSKDGEMPDVYYAVDTPKKSYYAEIRGAGLPANASRAAYHSPKPNAGAQKEPPSMTIDFIDADRLDISDNIDGDSWYDVDIEQFDAAGKIDRIQLNDVGRGDKGSDAYQIDIGKWNGGKKIGVKHDDEGNGFADDDEVLDDDEANDIADDDGGPLLSYLYPSIKW